MQRPEAAPGFRRHSAATRACGHVAARGAVAAVIVAALLVYFLYELITTKKLKNLLRAAPFLLVIVVLDAAFSGAVVLFRNSALAFTPNADEIVSVTLEARPSSADTQTFAQAALENVRFNDPQLRAVMANSLKADLKKLQAGTGFSGNCTVMLLLKSGKSVERNLEISSSDNGVLQSALQNEPAALRAVTALPDGRAVRRVDIGSLTAPQCRQVYAVFTAEYAKLSLSNKLAVMDSSNFSGTYLEQISANHTAPDVYDTISLRESVGPNDYTGSFSLTGRTPEALRLYIRLENAGSRASLTRFLQANPAGLSASGGFSLRLLNARNQPEFTKYIKSNVTDDGSGQIWLLDSTAAEQEAGSANAAAVLRNVDAVLRRQLGGTPEIGEPTLILYFPETIGTRETAQRTYYMPADTDTLRALAAILGNVRGTAFKP